MAKLTLEEIQSELAEKFLTLESDYSEYKNLASPILVKCAANHIIQTNLRTIRMENFVCNQCVGGASRASHISNQKVPIKKGHRIIGFDNASHNMGVAIFDDGKLVYYNLLQFNKGTAIQRLNKIRDMLEEVIIPLWEPDFIQFEGTQQQKSYGTFEVLTKLQGVFEMACERFGIPYDSARAGVWRGHHAINNRNRELDKKAAIQKVKEMYDIVVGDDVAEAILIAKYRSDLFGRQKLEDLF